MAFKSKDAFGGARLIFDPTTLHPHAQNHIVSMPGQKRTVDTEQSPRKPKKSKIILENLNGVAAPLQSALTLDEVDFPRGGGSTLTPYEIKSIRAEAIKEADADLFKVSFSLR